MAKEYLKLHLLWRSEIRPPEEAQIDESVFEEIYRMQEASDDGKRIHEEKNNQTYEHHTHSHHRQCPSMWVITRHLHGSPCHFAGPSQHQIINHTHKNMKRFKLSRIRELENLGLRLCMVL